MSLVIGLTGHQPGTPLAAEPSVSFDDDENGGHYWFLYPFFKCLAENTGQYIDLYGVCEFRGDDLQSLRQSVVEARQLVATKPERWSVHVGTLRMPNAPVPPPSREVFKEVERSKLLALLETLLGIVDRSAETGQSVVCLGD